MENPDDGTLKRAESLGQQHRSRKIQLDLPAVLHALQNGIVFSSQRGGPVPSLLKYLCDEAAILGQHLAGEKVGGLDYSHNS